MTTLTKKVCKECGNSGFITLNKRCNCSMPTLTKKEEEALNEMFIVVNSNTPTEIRDWFIKILRHSHTEMIKEILEKVKSKNEYAKGTYEGEQKEWKIFYEGFNEAITNVLTFLSTYLDEK
jgi:hypothetical protein